MQSSLAHRPAAGERYGTPLLGVNLEITRSDGLSTSEGLRAAAAAGYRFVEPYVYAPARRRVNSHVDLTADLTFTHYTAGPDGDDPAAVRAALDASGLRFSALSAHAPLLSPVLGVEYVEHAIVFAAATGSPVVNTDEGPLPAWMTLEEAFKVLTITLRPILAAAERHGVTIGLEPHDRLTTDVEWLDRVLRHFSGAPLGVNFDTGNAYLAGNDPVDMIRAIGGRIVHVHAKDIPSKQAAAERGAVQSTRVGCTVGEGALDFPAIVAALRDTGFDGVLCVECDTAAQATASRTYLEGLLAQTVATVDASAGAGSKASGEAVRA